jgi:exonuclease SbcC
MIPVKLQISGFLSYQEPTEVEFTGFNLACISGSNGAGKSSLLDAMTWVLFGRARQNDDSIINSHKDTARVVFIFDYEGQTYRVTREKHKNKAGVLEFNIKALDGEWAVLTRESIRKTEALICDTLKMEYETFINASFFLQGKADQFAQKNPADRKKVLSSILGLDQWENYRREASDRGKQVKSEIDYLDGQLIEIESELAQEGQRKQKLEEEEAAYKVVSTKRAEKQAMVQNAEKLNSALRVQKDAAVRVERDYKAAEEKTAQTRGKLDELEVSILDSQKMVQNAPQIEARYREWNSIREEKDRLQELSNRVRRLAEQRNPLLNNISAEKGRLEAKLTQLREQIKGIPATQAELDRLSKSLPEQKSQIDAWQVILDKRPEIVSKQQSLRDEATRAKSDANRIDKDIKDLLDRYEKLQTAGAECPLCGQSLTDSHRDEMLVEIKKEGQELRNRQDECKQLAAKNEKEIAALDVQIRECDQVLRQLQAGQREYDRTLDLQKLRLQDQKTQQAATEEEATVRALLDSGLYAADDQEEVARITAEIDALQFDENKLIRLSSRESELRPVEAEYRDLGMVKTRLEQWLEQRKSLQIQLEENEVNQSRLKTELDEAGKQLEELSNGLPDLAELTRELNALQDDEAAKLLAVGQARQQVMAVEARRKQKAEVKAERLEKTRLQDRLKTLEKAFGKSGVPALLIEEALPEIEDRANDILGRLSNDEMSVQLITQKEYKDKKREDKQETLDILISDGAGERAYELFSGGEAFRVNFAIRLALSQELAHRAGARLQTLVIDEGFGSQDTDGRQRLIETINTVQQNFEKILVITHMEELKEAFPARIEVEKTPQGSKVMVP